MLKQLKSFVPTTPLIKESTKLLLVGFLAFLWLFRSLGIGQADWGSPIWIALSFVCIIVAVAVIYYFLTRVQTAWEFDDYAEFGFVLLILFDTTLAMIAIVTHYF